MSRNDKAKAVKVSMHIDEPQANTLPVVVGEPSQVVLVPKATPRNLRHTETRVTHYFPGLLPFGTVTMTVHRNDHWSIKCGSVRMTGWGGDVDDVVKAFVAKVKTEVLGIASEVESSEFTTEPKSY